MLLTFLHNKFLHETALAITLRIMKTEFINYNLDNQLIQAIEDCGYFKCTPIQEKALPILLQGNDTLIQSKTGSGKTATFCIPLIEAINFEDGTKALILAPTRELAHQIEHEFNRLALYKRLNCVCLVGREDFNKQILQLKQKAHVVVGTPGRIFDHIESNTIKLDQVETLILDEASEMSTLGLIDQVKDIVTTLPKHKTWLFSATLGEMDQYKFLKLNQPTQIELDSSLEISSQIETYHIETNQKFETVLSLLNSIEIESCCIFINTREDTETVARNLKNMDYLVAMLHGGLEQKQRNKAIESFKKGKSRILVCTDIAARGIDVDKVSLVIHYDCPLTLDSYIHRSGRTGRKEEIGLSITLLSSDDNSSIFDTIKNETESYKIKKIRVENHFNRSRIKTDKDEKFKQKNYTLFIRAGKKDKIRNLDIVGSLCSHPNLEKENIGIIDVQENYTTVTLLNVDSSILKTLASIKIKGKNRKVELKSQ